MNEEPGLNPMDEDVGSGRGLVWLMLGVAAMGCGLLVAAGLFFFRADAQNLFNQYFPSPTVTASRTPIPTRTPTATPTPNRTATQQVLNVTSTVQAIQTVGAEAISSWDVVLTESFDDNSNGWPIGTRDGERVTSVRAVTEGKFVWDATAKDGVYAWITPVDDTVTDLYLSVDVQQTSGTNSSDYGLSFREDSDGDQYYFGISNNEFHVSINYEGEWSNLLDWQTSDAIVPDEKNKLTVIAQGSYFTFLINDQIVGEVEDDRIASGTCAIAIQVFEAGQQAIFEFDNFELRTP